jgi:XTP/dITP diphosphohydrolase
LAETRRFTGRKLVIATHNKGKRAELAALLALYGIETAGAAEFGLPEPAETGSSFVANAALKALAAAKSAGLPALADDSGLDVWALGGAPGIHSARWAGPGRDFAAAMKRVERELSGKDDHAARFVAALALAWPDGHVESFEGSVAGRLVFPPRGSRGFGYDPIFVPEGGTLTFGEMDPEEKERLSHRARAFARLAAACFGARP